MNRVEGLYSGPVEQLDADADADLVPCAPEGREGRLTIGRRRGRIEDGPMQLGRGKREVGAGLAGLLAERDDVLDWRPR
jgi:hypothetical protein